MIRAQALTPRESQAFKSSYSDSSEPGDCVEVAVAPATIHIRDSKTPNAPHLSVAPTTWTDFLTHAATR